VVPTADEAEWPEAVLLTGATGFLGVFLLLELLKQTTATIHCLVRGDDPQTARARLLRVLEAALPPGTTRTTRTTRHTHDTHDTTRHDTHGTRARAGEERDGGEWGRVEVVCGDLSRERLGLGEEQFAELANRVDAIYHNGAVVNSVLPYSALRQENVGSTEWYEFPTINNNNNEYQKKKLIN
jgi:thioester reductase-like protein